ncbi:class I SAM-dependent DNA methyltransferase [Roseibium sp.]|uniref:class I SAM-dependent DNA methyltransferase n=1 Tax=Roseibium sp. TaxID=1936156 RepID=UPI003A976D98
MTKDANTREEGFSNFVAGSTDTEAVAQYYDDWAKTYDATLADWEYEAPDRSASLVAPYLPKGARILDVGCGTGLVSEALRKHGDFHLDGLDISAESLKLAQARGTYDKLVCHDLQKLPLPVEDKAYDAAMSVGVLTYIEDCNALFRDLCRCVRSGGIVAFTQRTDRWEDLDFEGLIKAIEAEGLWSVVHIGKPRGYLPGNADFGDNIKVIHTLCRVV